MKKAIMCIAVVIAMLCATHAYAISLADSYVASGMKVENTHQHITTNPAVVGGLYIIPTANNGFACLVSTNGPEAYPPSATEVGQHYYTSTANKVLADVGSATAGVPIYVTWGDKGMACSGNLFLDCVNARAEVYYKE